VCLGGATSHMLCFAAALRQCCVHLCAEQTAGASKDCRPDQPRNFYVDVTITVQGVNDCSCCYGSSAMISLSKSSTYVLESGNDGPPSNIPLSSSEESEVAEYIRELPRALNDIILGRPGCYWYETSPPTPHPTPSFSFPKTHKHTHTHAHAQTIPQVLHIVLASLILACTGAVLSVLVMARSCWPLRAYSWLLLLPRMLSHHAG
jgi:hypothetical protein